MSIPMTYPEVQANFSEWMDKVVAQKYPNITPSLFLWPKKFHFTLLMLPLESDE